jgi:hypothetical protein
MDGEWSEFRCCVLVGGYAVSSPQGELRPVPVRFSAVLAQMAGIAQCDEVRLLIIPLLASQRLVVNL